MILTASIEELDELIGDNFGRKRIIKNLFSRIEINSGKIHLECNFKKNLKKCEKSYERETSKILPEAACFN